MADVYGRLTGRAGVCMATLGPGATNLITGFADANMDRAPIVAIAGQGATTRLHKESHQILDLVELFRPITKYTAQILEPEIVPEVVRKAFKVAQTEKPGGSFIDFPENIAEMEVDAKPIQVQTAYTADAPARRSSRPRRSSRTRSTRSSSPATASSARGRPMRSSPSPRCCASPSRTRSWRKA